jgi:hypothetical protein
VLFEIALILLEQVAFHHDPWHDDDVLDKLYASVASDGPFSVTAAREGMTVTAS